MAELQQAPQQNGRQRKRSSRVDMTAMVDVAFLLLTFFILTTSLSKPKAMEVNKPVGQSVEINCKKMMTLYLQEDNIVSVSGCEQTLELLEYSANGLRDRLARFLADQPEGIISVKTTDRAVYGNLVDVLDEMKIMGVQKYAYADLTREDQDFLASKGF